MIIAAESSENCDNRSGRFSSTVWSNSVLFFFSSRRRHTRYIGDWSSDVCSSDLAGRGLLELEKVVIGERILERNFDCRRGPIGVERDADGHDIYSFTQRELFRIGAAGEDGESPIELLGEHDAGEFVRKGHGAERKFLVGALAKVIREAVGVAAEEAEFAGAAVAEFAEPFGEGVRIEVLSDGVEKDDGGGAISVKFLDGGDTIADLCDFDRT